MSELISGKEAFDAWIDGLDVYFIYKEQHTKIDADTPLDVFLTSHGFYIKPRTITINGIEVPAPFEPKCMEDFYVIDGTHSQGWINGNPANPALSMENPKWRTEEEIKQVVAALRSVFGKK